MTSARYYDESIPPDVLPVVPGAPVAISASVADLSVDLTWTGPGATTVDGVELDWGDSTPAEFAPSGVAAASHTYAAAGTYTVTVDPYGPLYPAATESVTVTAP